MTDRGDSAANAASEPFILGLTGSIGMGKSTCCSFFRAHDVPVLDSDEVVHRLYSQGGAVVGPVGELFPSAIVDGAISRAELGKCVLGNQEALKQLEAVVHPLVAQEKARFLATMAAQRQSLVVLDIPLLFETGAQADCDAVAVVSAPADVQRQRVLARAGMTDEKLAAILTRQMPDHEKRQLADFVIDTGVSLEETEGHVVALIGALKGRVGTAFHKLMASMQQQEKAA